MADEIPLIGSPDRLPASLGGLGLERVDHFPDPELGVQIRYGLPPYVKADVYLYDLGVSDLPGDVTSPEFAEWFDREVQGIVMAAGQGAYRDLDMVGVGFIRVPPENPEPLCRCASFTYRQNSDVQIPPELFVGGGVPVVYDFGLVASQLALRVDGGYFNKVRFNYPAEVGEQGFGGFVGFLVEWNAFLNAA